MTSEASHSVTPSARKQLTFRFAIGVYFFLLTLVFFSPWVFQGKIFLAADILAMWQPWASMQPPDQQPQRPHNPLISDPVVQGFPLFYNRQLQSDGLKHWNPLILGGLPAINALFAGYARYYPPNLFVHRWLSPHSAYMIMLFVHLMAAGIFMFLYLRRCEVDIFGSLFGATTWMFSGYAMVWFEFLTTFIPVAYFPLMLWVYEGLIGENGWRYGVIGAVSLGMFILAMHIQYLLYLGVMSVGYVTFLCIRLLRDGCGARAVRRLILGVVGIGIGAVCIGTVEWLPMAQLVQESNRAVRELSFFDLFQKLGRVFFRHWITLMFPDYFGSPVMGIYLTPSNPGHEYMNYNELCFYMGMAPLFGLWAAIVGTKNRYSVFWLLMTLLFASMMCGGLSFYPLYKWFPGLGKLNPIRILILFMLSAIVSSAFGISGLSQCSQAQEARCRIGWWLLLLIVISFALTSSHHKLILWFHSEMQTSPYISNIVNVLSRLRALPSPVILKPLLLAITSCTFLVVYLHLRKPVWRLLASGAVLLVLIVDLISFGRSYNTTVRPEQIYPSTPAIEFLRNQTGIFRVVQDTANGFSNNTLGPFGIEELGGYANVYPERTNRLMSFIESGNWSGSFRYDRWVGFRRHGNWPLYSLMNVRYVLTSKDVKVTIPFLHKVYEGEISIYENQRVLPRAFIVHRVTVRKEVTDILKRMAEPDFDPGSEVVLEEQQTAFAASQAAAWESARTQQVPEVAESVQITRYETDELEVDARLSENGWLVVSNTYFPGWKAYASGKALRLQRADCGIMAVALPAGVHQVRFVYAPDSVKYGKWISVVGALGVLAVGGAAWMRRQNGRNGAFSHNT